MLFVTTVKYSVISNSHSIGPIYLQRGLRQGYPLSSYLFIICAEGLSALLNSEVQWGRIHGYKVAKTAPPIFYLFFVDDSFLFFQAVREKTLG